MTIIYQFGTFFCYYCNLDLINFLTIPMARPSIAYDVYVPRFCHCCSNINSSFFVSIINRNGKPYLKFGLSSNPMNFIPNEYDFLFKHMFKTYCLNNNICKPLSFEEKYICKRVYLPIQDKYYCIENYLNMFGFLMIYLYNIRLYIILYLILLIV